MDFDIRINQSQTQALTITAQAVQALKILQFSQQELQDFLTEQTRSNPLLQIPGPASDQRASRKSPDFSPSKSIGSAEWRDLKDIVARPTSLRDHLLEQVSLAFIDPGDRQLAAAMVEMIDPDGYFRRDLADFSADFDVEESDAERILAKIQTFEPTGVGARNLAECLSLQLAERSQLTNPMQIMLENLPLLATYQLNRLVSKCGVNQEQIKTMVAQIRQLCPAPGHQFDDEQTLPVLPEIVVRSARSGDNLVVTLNSDLLPRVLLDRDYYAEVKKCKLDTSGHRFVMDCYKSARWLTRALDQRAQTLLKVATEIVVQQKDFFEHGAGHLKPLDLKTVAAAVGLHVSTVCRATANKYMLTDRGVFEMKYFFSTALRADNAPGCVSAESIQHRIHSLVQAEKAPLSDDAIARILRRDGVEVARRTVAKYRVAMNIPGSSTRYRQKSMSMAQQS